MKIFSQTQTEIPGLAKSEEPHKSLLGQPQVYQEGEIGSFQSIPGLVGQVNLQGLIAQAVNLLQAVYGKNAMANLAKVVLTGLPGKFGEARSDEPHTIYVNPEAMKQSIYNWLLLHGNEIIQNIKTIVQGSKPDGEENAILTPDLAAKINAKTAEFIKREMTVQLAETIAHEEMHAQDFQSKLEEVLSGKASSMDVPEAHGEAAGKAARTQVESILGDFDWYKI